MSESVGGSGSIGDVQRIFADALGEPGKRRFRIVAVINGETHILWMEKQQVAALGLGIAQLIEQASGTGVSYWEDEDIGIDESTRNQFRVGRLEVAYDPGDGHVVIAAYEIEQFTSGGEANLIMRVPHDMALYLAEQATDLVSKGRPMCPMCGNPMDPTGHVCPEQNGHLPFDLDDEFLDINEFRS